MKSIFSKIRDILWPIKANELKKFIPLSALLMFTIFIYCALRGIKDTILITHLGAEMISTAKLWGVLPSAIIFMVVYTNLSNLLAREKVYYTLLGFFIMFFAAYAFILFPNQEILHINLSNYKEKFYIFRYPIAMVENWTISIFYIMAELWGSIMLSLMFWQFANEITSVKDAKKYYSLFGLWGQIGMLAAGALSQQIANYLSINSNAPELEVWGNTLNVLMSIVIIVGLIMGILYRWFNTKVLTDKRYYDLEANAKERKNKKKKAKLTVLESFKLIFSSKYLGMIAILVLAYGISINLVEGVWKSAASEAYPVRNDYLAFMGSFQSYTALVTMLGMIIGMNVIRKVSWFAGAIMTPAITLATGTAFFIFFIYKDSLNSAMVLFGTTSLMMAVIFGAVQNILSKSIKYSAFDATKEMAYIPLCDDLKSKGKAAVDVVGARLGKSGGAVIQWFLIAFTGLTIPELSKELFVVFFIIMLLWIWGVYSLSREFEAKSAILKSEEERTDKKKTTISFNEKQKEAKA